MTSNDEMERQRFERWAKANGLSLAQGTWGGYYLADTAAAWRAWQAAIASKQEQSDGETDLSHQR